MELKDRKWKDFLLTEIFEINSTRSSIDRNKLINASGIFPYITRTDKNNGVDGFICKQDPKYHLDSRNVITIGLDTQTVFYHQFGFYTGQNIQILKSNYLNKQIADFLIPLIKIQMLKFNWGGNGATLTRLKKSKILLPVNSLGEPDYAFMEGYIRVIEHKRLNNYSFYINKKMSSLKEVKNLPTLKEKEWEEFQIGKLFKLFAGKSKGLNHLRKVNNQGVNYLGATNLNNGVLCQVEKTNSLIQKGNCIAFIRNGEGSMGYSIYKKEDFIATSDISVGYSEFLNEHIGLFITTVADKVRGKYNFGYKRSEKRLKNEKILLPVKSKGQPDYDYMEQFVQNIELHKLKNYSEWKSQN